MNTAVTYAALVVAMRWIDYRIAYSVVYLFGVVLAYVLQSAFVFRVSIAWRKAVGFPAVYIVQYLVGLAVLWLLLGWGEVDRPLAALAAVIANVPVGFVLSRWWLARGAGARCT